MEMLHLPFRLRALTLAVASIVFASQPVSKARAETSISTDSEWNCDIASDGSGWQCTVVPVKKGVIKRAPRPVIAPENATRKTKIATSTVAVSKPEKIRSQLDWVKKSKLTDNQQKTLNNEEPWCVGAYVEPPRPGKNFRGDPDSAPLIADANESTYKNSIATLLGSVRIRQGNRQLESDEALLDNEKHFGEFEGNVTFREPGTLIVGDFAESQLDSGRTSIDNAQYVMHESHARGSASTILRNEDATMELDDATYTTCPPDDKGWQLSGGNVTLNTSTGYGTAKNAVIRVQGLPVFYSPYLYFPIDDRRQSGFLTPNVMGYDEDSGVEFDFPYYWNIAPNYDATFTPKVMAKRGLLLETEFRYLTEKDEGEIGVAGLIDGDQLKDENRYYKEDRWFFNARHVRQFTSRWTAELDYADASDKDYLEDFSSGLNHSGGGTLNQRVLTRYEGGNDINSWQAKLDIHKLKNMGRTSDDPYNKLPQVVLKGNWQATDKVNINYLTDYTYFDRADEWNYLHEKNDSKFDDPAIKESVYNEGFGIKRALGSRAYFETDADYPMQTNWGFLTPAVKVRSVSYNLSNLNETEVINDLNNSYLGQKFTSNDFTKSPTTTVPTFSVDSGLFFDRETTLFDTSYTHTLEPRMKYLYSPYVEGQEFNPIFDTGTLGFSYSSLWQDNRFSSYDRISDASQLSLGITTRFIQDNGFEKMRFGIGQIVHFADRKVYIGNRLGAGDPNYQPDENLDEKDKRLQDQLTAKTSPIASEFIYNFTRTMSLRQDFVWAANENRIDNYALTYRFKPEDRKTFNAGFRYADRVERYVKDENDKNIDDASSPTGFKMHDNNLKSTDISFAWPIPYTQNWAGMGRWQYDLTNKRNLEELVGIEYASCCYQVRLFWRSYVKSTDNIDHPKDRNGIYLQFVLRGLGSLTGSSGKEYLQGISGYTIREK